MHTHTLTDAAHDVWVDSLKLLSRNSAPTLTTPWTVTKRTLRGGRREGVDLIEVDNGAFAFSVIPTRGMGLWKGHCKGLDVGWDSPVTDGPVNPAFVNLMESGGLGWINGFDELLARCGLANNGAPYIEGHTIHGLHGKIANIPAHYVAVHIGDGPDAEIVVEGHVDESRLFSTQVRMVSTVTTGPGANWLTVRDEFRNLGDTPQDIQALYHWNFGPPFLEEGARLLAPARTVVPRDARASAAVDRYSTYGPPEPGFAEEVYFFEMLGSSPDSRQTLVLLQNKTGDKGVALRFDLSQLPYFTLWKNTNGLRSGYVTGLEPGTNYPNPKPFEKTRGRVVTLLPGQSHVTETTLSVLASSAEVAAVAAEIASLQSQAAAQVHQSPKEPFAAV
jgi:hypothetical protein